MTLKRLVAELRSEIERRQRTQHAQHESEERLTAVVELVPDLLWRTGADGQVQWYNRRWLEYTGDLRRGRGAGALLRGLPRGSRAGFRLARASGDAVREELRLRSGANGEAMRLVGQGDFDLVISDLGLPDIDGCSLMAKLREPCPELTGIALSGWGMEEDLRRSSSAGFVNHLVKPVAVAKLDEAISHALAARSPAHVG